MLTPDSRRLFALDDDIAYLDHGAYGVTPREVLDHRTRTQLRVETAPRAFFDQEYAARLGLHSRQRRGAFRAHDRIWR